MTLQPQPILPVPEETTRVAQAAFPEGNVYLQRREELGTIYEDAFFASYAPQRGNRRPVRGDWRW